MAIMTTLKIWYLRSFLNQIDYDTKIALKLNGKWHYDNLKKIKMTKRNWRSGSKVHQEPEKRKKLEIVSNFGVFFTID